MYLWDALMQWQSLPEQLHHFYPGELEADHALLALLRAQQSERWGQPANSTPHHQSMIGIQTLHANEDGTTQSKPFTPHSARS